MLNKCGAVKVNISLWHVVEQKDKVAENKNTQFKYLKNVLTAPG